MPNPKNNMHMLTGFAVNPRDVEVWRKNHTVDATNEPRWTFQEGNELKVNSQKRCFNVWKADALTFADLFPANNGHTNGHGGAAKPMGKAFVTVEDAVAVLQQSHGPPSSRWTYHDANGQPVGVVVRWDKNEGKEFRPLARHADGWRIVGMSEPRPLYALPSLPSAKCVVVCEGEKAADKARALGFTATTSAGGAQAAAKTDWQPLAGKEIWIFPDNDDAGRTYAATVADILIRLSPKTIIRIVNLPELPEGGDIVDWIDAHGDAAEPDSLRRDIEAMALVVEPWRAEEAPDHSFKPFPITALPEPVKSFIENGARAIGCDASFLALPMVVAIGAAIGNTRRLQLKPGWSAPPIIWGAIVGESGSAKSPAFKLVMRPVRELQKKALERHTEAMKKYEMDLARWEKEMTTWRRDKKNIGDPPEKPKMPQAERLIVSDTTVEALAPILLENRRGVLMARDELAGWIGSFDRYSGKGKASSDSANWLPMFNAESIIVDRKSGTPRTIYVPLAAVSVCGGIQPSILQRVLSQEHRESGLAARLLLAYPPRLPKHWVDAGIDPNAEAEMNRLFAKLYELQMVTDVDGQARPETVRLSCDAKTTFKAYYNEHAKEQVELSGDMAAAWSKLEEYAARLALVIHFIRWAADDPSLADASIVDAQSMNAAIVLAKWFKNEARRVYAMLDEDDVERDDRKLIEFIERKGGEVTEREVQQGCRWLKKPGEATAALEKLFKAGNGTWKTVPTTARGGRETRLFVTTPPTVYETPADPAESVGSVDVDSVDTAGDEAGAFDGADGNSEPETFPDTDMTNGPYDEGY